MKKIKIILLVLTLILIRPVYAANYEIKELIPKDIKTTIVTNNFSYREFSFEDNKISFSSIKNLSDKDLPISISIGLFNEKRRNIGTINYCKDHLSANEERQITIDITEAFLGKDYKAYDVKYISVLGDNINCRTTGSDEYLGQTIKQITYGKNNTLDSQTQFLIKILSVVGGILLLIFLYQFLFTKSYQNFDGDDVRQGYKNYNKELKEQREEELRKNPPKPKEKKKIKTDEVLMQEEQAKNEDKSGTDLHNLYK